MRKTYNCHCLGIIGASRSQTTASILQMLQDKPIPVLSPFASLPELREYPNFLRTTPADSEQVQVGAENFSYFSCMSVCLLFP